MTEIRDREYQERFDWYKVNNLLLDMGRTSAVLGMEPQDLVHMGGSATFYRLYQAFGPMVVSHFRGTHDIDIMSFSRGAVQRVLDVMKADEKFPIKSYTVGHAFNLPNKRSIYIDLGQNLPGSSTGFEIDIYEPERDAITFNHRVMSRNQIILDPPEQLKLSTLNPRADRGLVSVPSLRDSFVIKMDIMDYSLSGLRLKDRIDVLATLSVCKAIGYDFRELLDAVVDTSPVEPALRRLLELEKLFSNPVRAVGKVNLDNPLIPSEEVIGQALADVKKVRRKLTDR